MIIRKVSALLIVISALTLFPSFPSHAEDYYWIGSAGDKDWHNGNNWVHGPNLRGVPPNGSDVYIIGMWNPYEVFYGTWDSSASNYNSLNVNSRGGGLFPVFLRINYSPLGNILRFRSTEIGGAGRARVSFQQGYYATKSLDVDMGGAFFMTGADTKLSCSESMSIGDTPYSSFSLARYYQEGGLFDGSHADVVVGAESSTIGNTGLLHLADGEMRVGTLKVHHYGSLIESGGLLQVGDPSSPNTLIDEGLISLEGGTLDLGDNGASEERIGATDGYAYFYHDGGDNKVASLFLGPEMDGEASRGTYHYNKGKFTWTGPFGGNPRLVSLKAGGRGGYGTFAHRASNPLTVEWVYLGYEEGGVGVYTLSEKSSVEMDFLFLGYGEDSRGYFSNEGGKNVVNNTFVLGIAEGSLGRYELSGDGVLVLHGLQGGSSSSLIGAKGEGVFVQKAGSAVVDRDLSIARGPAIGENAKGSYELWGGTLKVGHNLYVGDSKYGQAEFIQHSGMVSVGSFFFLTSNPTHTARYSLLSGTLEVISGERISGQFTHTAGTNYAGRMTIGNGGVYDLGSTGYLDVSNEVIIWPGGQLNVRGGRIDASDVDNYAEITGYGQINADVRNKNGGDIRIGFGPTLTGALTINGNLFLEDGSTLLFDIAGYDQGTGYDYLYINNYAVLGGDLVVDLWNGFDPVVGSAFDLIYADIVGISGIFDNLYLPDLGPDKYWDPVYTDHKFSLYVKKRTPSNVVPEPASAVLFALGLVGTLYGRRKQG